MPVIDPTLLANVPLFTGVEPIALADVLAVARVRRVPAGAFYFRENDPATHLYVLTEGRLKITQLTPEGHQVIHMLLTGGQPFGGVAALGEGTYPVTAEAVEECIALAWDAQTMTGLMRKYPDIAINTARFLARRFHELQVQHRQLMTERVERRVARALLKLADNAGRKAPGGVEIDFPLSRQDLAEMTGTTLFTVSRLLSGWDEKGLIKAERQRVTVLDPAALVAIAEG
jgi:CRP/FNR family transcriptional regulator, nitrogen oxide reductase regulator